MPYCPQCGKEVLSETKFCPNCGFGLQQQLVVQTAPTQATISSPLQPPIGERIGHKDMLTVIWIALLVGIAISAGIFLLGFLVALVMELAATEVIYEDAKAINKAKGRKVLNATLWSLFAFLLAILAVPWYVFSGRKAALAMV